MCSILLGSSTTLFLGCHRLLAIITVAVVITATAKIANAYRSKDVVVSWLELGDGVTGIEEKLGVGVGIGVGEAADAEIGVGVVVGVGDGDGEGDIVREGLGVGFAVGVGEGV